MNFEYEYQPVQAGIVMRIRAGIKAIMCLAQTQSIKMNPIEKKRYKAQWQRDHLRSPEQRAIDQRKYLDAHPEKKLRKLITLEENKMQRGWTSRARMERLIGYYEKLGIPAPVFCLTDYSICRVNEEGFGQCGDKRDECPLNSKKDPRQAVA